MLRTIFTHKRVSIIGRLLILRLSHLCNSFDALKGRRILQYNVQCNVLIKKHFPFNIIINNNIRRNYADFPSHRVVKFPALSPTMEIGKVAGWIKKEGDKINEGDLIVEIETDKATLGMESADEGYLAKIILETGTSAPVGAPLFILVEDEKDIAAFKDYKADIPAIPTTVPGGTPPSIETPPPVSPAIPQPVQTTVTAAAPTAGTPPAPGEPGKRVLASPMAKRLAEQHKIRLEGKGTGLFDSITSKDLDKILVGKMPQATTILPTTPGQQPIQLPQILPPSPYLDIPVTGIRATIAKRLLESKTTIPHYYLTTTCHVDKLIAMRISHNKKVENDKAGPKISVNDFMIKACAYACVKVPEVNAIWMDKFIRQFKNVDVSVAVATPRGLITPIIFDAHIKGITDISKEVRDLASRAKEGKLKPNEYQGGTISISNLGMYGVEDFCAIINPPQCSILAVGTVKKRVISGKDGFKEASYVTVTLSSDHRVADGAVGAQWLQYFQSAIEDPTSMIL